ncbi:MAG: WG repeat-containing protein [Acidobacteriota bacterium]
MGPLPDLIPICEHGSWGYIDRTGKVVIRPSFTMARPFRNGLACVNVGGQTGRSETDIVGGKWGFIDPSGAYAFPARFDEAFDFSEGLAAVNLGARTKYAAHDDFYYTDGGKWGFVDRSGNIAIPIKYDYVKSARGGLAPVCESGRCGYLRGDGEWEIPPTYSGASPFYEGFAVVRVGNRYGYINLAGDYLIQPRFELAYDFHKGLAAGHTADPYVWIFFDTAGNERFTAPEGTTHVGNFSEGLIMANLCKLERYNDGRVYPSGMCRSLGYLNDRGQWVIKPQFAWGGDFSEGRAWVKLDEGPYAYIRPDGSLLRTPQLESAATFENGLAAVRIAGKFALLDTHGKVFWSES